MTRKWLVAIIAAIMVVLIGVWLYTGWAAEEVEPDVADDPVTTVSLRAPAPAGTARTVGLPGAAAPGQPPSAGRRRIG